ncbi:MAG: replicative DNA helicase [Comamonadaceae bacterium]|nr:replicative DNA helicase [Comamonadaceae bacterium]
MSKLDRARQAGRRRHRVRVARERATRWSRPAGWPIWARSLAQNTPSAANIRRYAEIVRERAVLRKLVTVGDEIAASALNPLGKDAESPARRGRDARSSRSPRPAPRGTQGFVPIQPLLGQVVERIQELYDRENPSDITGVPTGFTDLDQKTSGLQPGDLIIVAGRPSDGQDGVRAQHRRARRRRTRACRWRSSAMEMAGHPAGDALAGVGGPARPASGAHRPPQRRRMAAPHRTHWASCTRRRSTSTRRGGINAVDLRARARRRLLPPVRQAGPDRDRLPAAHVRPPSEGENRATEISEISRSHQVPGQGTACAGHRAVAAQPAARAAAQQAPGDVRSARIRRHRAGCRPHPVHLPRRGATTPTRRTRAAPRSIIGKQRNGPTGTVRLTFLGEYTRFQNYAQPGGY